MNFKLKIWKIIQYFVHYMYINVRVERDKKKLNRMPVILFILFHLTRVKRLIPTIDIDISVNVNNRKGLSEKNYRRLSFRS